MLIIFAKLSVSYFSTYTLLSLIINMRCHTLQFNMGQASCKNNIIAYRSYRKFAEHVHFIICRGFSHVIQTEMQIGNPVLISDN